MSKEKSKNDAQILALVVAFLNLIFFLAMFGLMQYFELLGSDPTYFDSGTLQNLKYINMVTEKLGIEIDPTKPHKVTTLFYALCFGVALISTFFAFIVAKRKNEYYEVTKAG